MYNNNIMDLHKMDKMEQYFSFKKMEYEKGFLDENVDATYIIHLKNNGRWEHIQTQLKKYHPTKTVYILINDDYEKMKKSLPDKTKYETYQNITDTFLYCYSHADKHHYENILILEDDFIFTNEMKKRENLDEINTFLKQYKDKSFIYYLGGIPSVAIPIDSKLIHYRPLFISCSHAIIYSKKIRETIKTFNFNNHYDIVLTTNIFNKYMFHKALCYQTFSDTENKNNWYLFMPRINYILQKITNYIIKILNLNTNPEKGFAIIYAFSKISLFMILINSIIFLLLIFNYNKVIHIFSEIKNEIPNLHENPNLYENIKSI